jgi:LysR family transcriptional regulator, nod-box dependent transcriptional activator
MQLKAFDLGLLRALDALLADLNVTHAAARLGVTQQAMSGSLRRLRDHFNDPLLVRVGRNLEPTPLAITLREPVREVILQIGLTLEVKPQFDPAVAVRQFKIALSDYATMILLPHFMPLLAARAPGITCAFRPIDNMVYRDVEQGELDFCLLPHNWRLYQQTKPRDLRTIDLFADDFVCAVARDHPIIGKTMTMAEYKANGHCMVEFGGSIRSMIAEAWARAQLDLQVVATATSFAALLFMVPGTSMIATAQRRLVAAFEPLLPIRAVECPLAIGQLDEALSWHQRNDDDAAHAFVRSLFDEASQAIR